MEIAELYVNKMPINWTVFPFWFLAVLDQKNKHHFTFRTYRTRKQYSTFVIDWTEHELFGKRYFRRDFLSPASNKVNNFKILIRVFVTMQL